MLGNNKIRRTISAITGIAVLCVASLTAMAAPGDVKADITVNGQVTVNGQPAVSNSTVVSGSTITTGANSSAVIGLANNGRVELMPETSLTLRFTENSIVAMLSSGKVQISNRAGIGATVTTRSATVVADAGQANLFTVDIGCGDDIKCAQTLVQTTNGLVTLKSGKTTKQVAAGTDAVAGGSQTGCKPCFRPGSAPPVAIAGIGAGALAAILVGVGAAAVAAIIYGKKNRIEQDGPVIVVSPIQ
ncbi:MAG: FecR domain-containing protein [Acidobacteriota bacterium]|nr:FecR domain-containing protein [Acidobacteriota bacterium]MDH3529607.1 FecR domain-containing protein [Acidobacteriota bacterium]